MQTVSDFMKLYFNAENVVLVAIILIALFVLLDTVLYFLSFIPLKRIIRILRTESGENIILAINSIHLPKRYRTMWDDYFDAYHNENTVTLSNYLIKDDLGIFFSPFKYLSFGITLISGVAVLTLCNDSSGFKVTPPFLLLLTVFVIAEFIHRMLFVAKSKKIARLKEEFYTLSLRRLPGKAIDFSSMYVLRKIDRTSEQIRTLQNSLTQVNARLDRQYEIFTATSEEE